MEVINYTGDRSLLMKKGFILSDKDPFFTGTLQKAIGNGYIILIREDNEIRLMINDLIFPGVEILKTSLDKMGLPYEIINI